MVELSVGIEAGVGDLEVGVSGRLMVMLEGGWIGEMFRECGDGRVLLLVELFWREVDCILEDFLDIDLLSRRFLDLLVKYLSSKMSGFEVLAFKSIPRGRGGVIMIENGLGICRRSQGTHYPPDKAKILNSWSHDQSLCCYWLHKN